MNVDDVVSKLIKNLYFEDVHLLRKNICPLKLEELNKYQLLKIHNFDEEAKQFEHLHQEYTKNTPKNTINPPKYTIT